MQRASQIDPERIQLFFATTVEPSAALAEVVGLSLVCLTCLATEVLATTGAGALAGACACASSALSAGFDDAIEALS